MTSVFSDAYFISFLFVTTISLLFIGFWKKQYFCTLVSGVGFFLLGFLFMRNFAFQVLANTSSTVAGNVTTVVYNYTNSSWVIPFNPTISFFFVLIGLMLFIVSALDYFRASENPDTEVEE